MKDTRFASCNATITTDYFENYQRFTEDTISNLSNKITDLEQQLDVFTNLLQISQYINQYIKSQDLFPLINDMLIGVFGAKYSTIYIKSEEGYEPVTPSTFSYPDIILEKKLITEHEEKDFILNTSDSIYGDSATNEPIYSCIGVPIKVNTMHLGFIIIQHQKKNYFSSQHIAFLLSLANHIGVAIENNLLYNKIKENANKDGLTNIFNKKYFFDTVLAIPNILNLDYSIVMIDIDNFKHINDAYGHPYGDEVLKTVASILKNCTRNKDIVSRYGGEEFIIFFNDFTDLDGLYSRLEMIRKKIEETIIPGDDFETSVTASIGCYRKKEQSIELKQAIQLADNNLYTCKKTGKNKIVIS